MTRASERATRRLIRLAIIALSLFHIGFLLFKVVTFYPDVIHSDAAVAPLLAMEILESGQLVPEGWYHANNDVWLLNRHLFVLPFLPVFGLGHASYLAMQFTFMVLLAASAVFILRPMLSNREHLFIGVAFLSIPFSRVFYNHVYGEISYGPILIYILLAGGLFVRASLSRKTLNWPLIFLVLLCVQIAASNPSRYAAYLLAPALVTLFLMRGAGIRMLAPFCAVMVSALIGTCVHAVFTTDLYLNASGKSYGLANPLAYFDNILRSFNEIFKLVDLSAFVANSGWGTGFMSGLYSAAVFLAAGGGLLVFVAKFGTLRAAGRLHAGFWRYRLMLLIVFLTSFLCVLGALTVTSAPIINRVFLPPFFLVLLVLFASFLPLAFRDVRVGGLYVLLLAVPMVFAFTSKRTDAPYLERELGVLREIEALGLTYGYSTDFWRSNVATLITAEEVTIRPLHYDGNLFEPRRWLTHRDWYEPAQDGRFFVLAKPGHTLNLETLAYFGIVHVESVQIELGTIHVFDGHQNLPNLPNWAGDDRVLQGHPLYSRTEVGVIVDGPDGVTLENNGPGLLAEGPGKPLRKGEYGLDIVVTCSADAQATAEMFSLSKSITIPIGSVCPAPNAPLLFWNARNVTDAALRLVVERGAVRFFGFEAR